MEEGGGGIRVGGEQARAEGEEMQLATGGEGPGGGGRAEGRGQSGRSAAGLARTAAANVARAATASPEERRSATAADQDAGRDGSTARRKSARREEAVVVGLGTLCSRWRWGLNAGAGWAGGVGSGFGSDVMTLAPAIAEPQPVSRHCSRATVAAAARIRPPSSLSHSYRHICLPSRAGTRPIVGRANMGRVVAFVVRKSSHDVPHSVRRVYPSVSLNYVKRSKKGPQGSIDAWFSLRWQPTQPKKKQNVGPTCT